jgi:hypothetical protein
VRPSAVTFAEVKADRSAFSRDKGGDSSNDSASDQN